MPELLKLIQAYLANANMRGVDPENPIPFLIRAPEGQPNQGKQFIIQVGYGEPTFNQLPYNVLWICFDKERPYYAKLYRRIAHHKTAVTPDLNYTWEELTDYAQVFEKEQYYRPVADLDLVDDGSPVDPILTASTEALGTVKTNVDEVEPRAILKDDDRLSDARDPKPHVHENKPRTMLKLFTYSEPVLDEEGEQVVVDGAPVSVMKRGYLKVDAAFPPSPNEILFIDHQDEKDPNVWHGVWRQPTQADILDVGANLLSIEILEPTADYGDNQDYQFELQLNWDDQTNEKATSGVTWELSDNNKSIALDPASGLLTVPDIEGDTQVTITARYSSKGKEFTDTADVLLKDTFVPVVPQEIVIEGKTTVTELETATYVVKLKSSDGSLVPVTPDSFVSNNTAAAIINVAGELTTYNVDQNENVTITAQYTTGGQTFTATFDLVVVDKQAVSGLEIRGVTSMNEETTESFEVFVTYADETEAKVTPETFVIKSGDAHATLTGFDLTANDVKDDQTVVLEAAYTAKGQPLTATHTVTIKDLDVYPSNMIVTAYTAMDENTTQDIKVEIVMDDNSRVVIDTPDSVVSSNAAVVVEGLTLKAQSVTTETQATVTVTHTYEGQQFNEDVFITVRNSESVPTGIAVNGATSINEGESVNLNLNFTNDDGTQSPITDFTNLTITQAPAGLLTITKIAPQLKVEATGSVTVDTEVVITLEYTHNGETWTDTHTVTLVNSTKEETNWRVVGPTSVHVGKSGYDEWYEYELEVDFDDDSQANKNALEWRIEDNSKVIIANQDRGRIAFATSEDKILKAETFTIEGKYNINGVFEWKPLVVTIEPMETTGMEFTLYGDSNVDEGNTTRAYAPKVAYNGSMGTTWDSFGTLTSLEFVGDAHGCVITDSTKVTAPSNLTAGTRVTLIGTFDWRDETGLRTEAFELSVADTIPNFKLAKFKPAKSTYEVGEEIDPTVVEYELSNGTKHPAVAKSVTITAGADSVTVSGTGSSTRFTVKPDNATTQQVKWTGVVEIDGVEHAVGEASVTANKVPSGYPFITGLVMAPTYIPTDYGNDLTKILEYYATDKNATEITDQMARDGFDWDLDIQGYPMDMGAGNNFTSYLVMKKEWGEVNLYDRRAQGPVDWKGARIPITGEPPTAENSLGEPPYDYYDPAFDPLYAEIEYEGSIYRVYRFHFPKSSGPNPAVEQFRVSFTTA